MRRDPEGARQARAEAEAAAARLREDPARPIPAFVAAHIRWSLETERDRVMRAWYERALSGGERPDPEPRPAPAATPPARTGRSRAAAAKLSRPAPTPTCAGITPGWQWLLREGEPVTVRDLRLALRRLEREVIAAMGRQEREAAEVIDALLARIELLERRVPAQGVA
jgi:hypothetical protein